MNFSGFLRGSARAIPHLAHQQSIRDLRDPNHNHRLPSPQPIIPPTPPLGNDLFERRVQSFLTDPGIKNPQTRFKLCWPPDHYTKARVLAVKELYAERVRIGFIRVIPWASWLPAMLGHLPKLKDHVHEKNGRLRFKELTKMKQIKVNVNRWNPLVVKLNYALNPRGLKVAGCGRKDDIPDDVQLAAYKDILDVVHDPVDVLYRYVVADFFEFHCEAYGMKVFASANDMKSYKARRDAARSTTNSLC